MGPKVVVWPTPLVVGGVPVALPTTYVQATASEAGGVLTITKAGTVVAMWAASAWQRVEFS